MKATHPWKGWYKLARWQRIRLAQLKAEPLCRMCAAEGEVTPASVCDHMTPHRGDPVLFWSGPFQSLCASHHNADKQAIERGGKPKLRRTWTTISGWPA